MTGNIWEMAGRTLYWLCWPALSVYLYFTRRTRILVVVKDEVLVLKGWFSDGRLALPGGGLRSGEDPKAGALRELYEETGIKIEAKQLKPLLAGRIANQLAHNFFVYAYLLELPKKPAITRRKPEIRHLQWMKLRDLVSDTTVSPTLKAVLDTWQDKG